MGLGLLLDSRCVAVCLSLSYFSCDDFICDYSLLNFYFFWYKLYSLFLCLWFSLDFNTRFCHLQIEMQTDWLFLGLFYLNICGSFSHISTRISFSDNFRLDSVFNYLHKT